MDFGQFLLLLRARRTLFWTVFGSIVGVAILVTAILPKTYLGEVQVIVDSKARAILVWRGGEDQPPTDAKHRGVGVVKTVAECLDILTQADSPGARDQPGVVNRVLRLLGLKESGGS